VRADDERMRADDAVLAQEPARDAERVLAPQPVLALEPVLALDNVTKEYALPRRSLRAPRPHVRAVADVSLSVAPAQSVGIVGESGSGKSTLGRLALAITEPTSGRVLLDGVDPATVRGAARRRLGRSVQGIFQDPTGSLDPRRSVGASIAESLEVGGLRGAALTERTAELLALVGLDPARADDRPRRFSGGQRQRVVIARALAAEPRLLVADEPVSALDVSVQAQVLNLFRDLQDDSGVASLFISHDLAVVGFVSDVVVVMFHGRVVETGSAYDVLASPAHPYSVALRAAASEHPEARESIALADAAPAATGCVYRSRCPIAMPVCAEVVPELVAIAPDRQAACHALTAP
jgi:oligopeptide/dipeptide ABC transporter ATP-binding protein